VSEAKSLYSEVILDHIKNARNFHELKDANRKAHGVNPLCGDTFDVYAVVEGDRVVDAAFQCECCGISMASASIMTETEGQDRAGSKDAVPEFCEIAA